MVQLRGNFYTNDFDLSVEFGSARAEEFRAAKGFEWMIVTSKRISRSC